MRVTYFVLFSAALSMSCEGVVEGEPARPLDDTAEATQGLGATATYDAVLKTPHCTGQVSGCTSGTLLNGRAGLGPEAHAPNTLLSACADGTAGTYHSDESVDALSISVVDGSSFAAGKAVVVDVAVWAYVAFSSDKLDVYYASNAAAPSWQLIGTLTPTKAGSQTLSATFPLAATGGTHVVRAQLRYGGSASSCAAGPYNDADDVAFDVAGTPPAVDAGTPPPVDAGTPPPVDAGTPPLMPLVTNGGFESEPSGWSLSGASISTLGARTGSRAISLWSGDAPTISQVGATAPAGVSTVSAWVRGTGVSIGAPGTSTLTLSVVRSGVTVTSCSLYNPSSSWAQLSCSFIANGQPATVQVTASASAGSSANYTLDDVSVQTTVPGVQNPGFEAGVTPWVTSSGAAVVQGGQARSGTAAAILPPSTGYGANVYQAQVTPPPGATKLAVWLSTRFTGSSQYAVVMVGGAGCSFSTSSTSGSHSPSTYVKRTCSLSGQTGPLDVRVRFSVPSTLPVPAGASVAVDDFSFE